MVEVPPAVVTRMSTVANRDTGETAVTCVGDTTVNEVASDAPNLTAVAPVRPVPLIVTVVPPATGPVFGEIEVMAGKAM